jgi:hypothetical protein
MQIRTAQLKVFEREAEKRFADSAWAHLQEFVPRHCAVAGEETMRGAIRAAMEAARARGLAQERPVLQFIDLSCVLGHRFYSDPQYPWISERFEMPAADMMARMDSLYEKTLKFVARTSGPQGELVNAALQRVSETPIENALRPSDRLPEAALAWLGRVFPEKAAFFGRERMTDLVSAWSQAAEELGLALPQGKLIYTTMAFFLGTGFASDPLAPWAHELTQGPPEKAEERVRRVYASALTALKTWFDDVHPGV